MVGVNSDRSTTSLKGDSRPLIPENHRLSLLAALEPIDYLTVFDQNTAAELLIKIRPHAYVKGGDYSPDTLPEKPVLEQLNIPFHFIPLIPGLSTSELIRKIKSTGSGM